MRLFPVMRVVVSGCLLATAPALVAARADDAAGVTPSPMEREIITRHLLSIRDPGERAAVRAQGTAWLMTTYLCQDAARPVLVRLGSSAHRFFLQDDRPGSQSVVSTALVQGRGQFLQAAGPIRWTAFTWACHLDPVTGRVLRFEVQPGADVPPGP
ncbi:hypothetical protein [Gluconacetobacter tumulisoli]|uniref:DUF930 domain-containing protein n=1 Tax=Gluconacetobacter tumulisoli TaxID=1286189 RepID=A0A7W4PKC0_9PROT|nr:hypothetical protein [Gluconacetobacter tumulisoli]MBB2200875.1 hypothetical protein [Gluconacetobacter tumulisoli]